MRPIYSGHESRIARAANVVFVIILLVGSVAWTVPKWGWSGGVESAPDRLVMEAPLVAMLQTLAGGLHNEITLCLTGESADGLATVSDLAIPEQTGPTFDGAAPPLCPPGALAAWHNHATGVGEWGIASYADRGSIAHRSRCTLSPADLQAAEHQEFPFVVVSGDPDTWCWWTRADVRGFADKGLSVGPSIPGQRSWWVPAAPMARMTDE